MEMTPPRLYSLPAAFLAAALIASPAAGRAEGAGAEAARPPRDGHGRYSISLAVGLPDSAAVSLLMRTLRLVRFRGESLAQEFGLGVRAGVSTQPRWGFAPSLALETGPCPGSGADAKLRALMMVPDDDKAALDGLGYSFASASIGIEIGDPDRIVFYLRAGLSRLSFDSKLAADAVRHAIDQGDKVLARMRELPGGAFLMPSVKGGFMMHF